MRFGFVIALLFSAVSASAQVGIAPLSDQVPIPLRSDSTLRVHTGIQPQIRQVHNHSKAEAVFANPGYHFRFIPVPDLAVQADSNFFSREALGAGLEASINKWYFRAMFTAGASSREGINQTHSAISPLNSKNQFYTDLRGRVGYTPNKFLHLSAGIDNQFFGEGYRSLIQGDQVAPNPFALMRVNFWRLEYGLLYQLLHENTATNRVGKFSTTHYISYNVTHHWNFGIVENVLFQVRDSVFNRGFEIEYLNPIVFFRPQEYSLGSSDNILLAVQSSYTFKKQCIYTQFGLDDFVLSEIKNRTRWWANKYAVQLGIKGDLTSKMSYRFETNIVRPYTYSHVGPQQSVSNVGRPLAHPQGGNFVELLAIWNLKQEKWHWKAYASFLMKGYDENATSWGGDVTRSYLARPPYDYGHVIGQGATMRSFFFGVEVARIVPKILGRIYVNPQISTQWGDKESRVTPMLTAGFRTALFQERKLF